MTEIVRTTSGWLACDTISFSCSCRCSSDLRYILHKVWVCSHTVTTLRLISAEAKPVSAPLLTVQQIQLMVQSFLPCTTDRFTKYVMASGLLCLPLRFVKSSCWSAVRMRAVIGMSSHCKHPEVAVPSRNIDAWHIHTAVLSMCKRYLLRVHSLFA